MPAKKEERRLITDPIERAKIKPKILVHPPEPYLSARDLTREKVLSQVRRHESQIGELTNRDSIDNELRRLHKVAENPNLPYKRRLIQATDSHYYVF